MTTFSIALENLKVKNYFVEDSDLEFDSFDQLIKSLSIGINTAIAFNEENERTKVILKLNYAIGESLHDILRITIEAIFNLEPFTQITRKESGKIKFVDDLIAHTIIGITFSTARGILFERLKGTKLQGINLPIVDPKKLLDGNLLPSEIENTH